MSFAERGLLRQPKNVLYKEQLLCLLRMSLGRGLRLVVLTALICVMAIFLHPAASGPFASTHGPLTPLRAQRLALAIISLLMICGTILRELLRLPLRPHGWAEVEGSAPA